MAGAKHAGGFRKGFDNSLDDLILVTVILKPDIELVATHEADPQHYFCHAHAPRILSRRPNPVANRHSTSADPSQRNSFQKSQSTTRYHAAPDRWVEAIRGGMTLMPDP